LTTEQLNQARAEAWHQAGNPLLTADDAAAWLRETGVCLFLPRAQQLATPAPSFVEAVLGASDPTPAREAIETATVMLDRLLASDDAIALNLLGTPGEQPDFLATTETLPFLFALTGDKEWKRGPRGKSSPLVIEVWKLLDRESPLTTIEVKEKLGRQLTEAAALRALAELWLHLRIEPVLKQGEPAAWQLLERKRQKQMQAGSTMSQAVALSALVSLYLQSAVAASGDEIEIFLSPLASRSKVRDAVRGLTATRQLSTLNLGPVEMYHVEGSLPEFAAVAPPEGAVIARPSADTEEGMGEGRRRFVAKRLAAEADQAVAGADPETKRPARPAAGRTFGKAPAPGFGRKPEGGSAQREGGSADRRPFAPRPGTTGGARKPYGTRAPGGSSFNPREPWKEDQKPSAPRSGGEERRPFAKSGEEGGSSAERRPFVPREGERKSFGPRTEARGFKPRTGGKPFGDRKPYTPREGGERKPFAPRGEAEGGSGERKSFAPRTGDRPFKAGGGGKSFGDRKPFVPRGDGERKPFTPREGGTGERKPFAPRGGDRPFKPGFKAKPFGESKSFGDRKPFVPRDGERKPFTPRSGDRPFKPRSDAKPYGERKSFGDRKPFTPREGGDRKPFTPRDGERKSFAPRGGDRSFKPRSDAKPFGDRKSFTPREGGDRKPFTPRDGERKSFAPRGGDRPFKPRSDARPPRPSSGPGEGRPPGARPSFGAAGPGAGRPSGTGARKTTGFRKTTGAARARTSPMTSTGKPRSGVRPPTGRPGPRATRGGAAGARGGVKRIGRPGKGRSK
jgi:23S rRNA pseudouridine2605 synthase